MAPSWAHSPDPTALARRRSERARCEWFRKPTSVRLWHARSAQRLGLGEDEPASECQRALSEQKAFHAPVAHEPRPVQEALRSVRQCRRGSRDPILSPGALQSHPGARSASALRLLKGLVVTLSGDARLGGSKLLVEAVQHLIAGQHLGKACVRFAPFTDRREKFAILQLDPIDRHIDP